MEQRKYSIEDFVADVTFQHYCTGRNPQALQYWEDYFERYPQKRSDAEEARKLYLLLSGNHTQQQYTYHLNLFKKEIQRRNNPHKIISIKSSFSKFWLVASCMVLISFTILFAYYHFSSSPGLEENRFSSKPGEKRTFTLNDGTLMTLNGSTTVILDKDFNQKKRGLKLDGEAYFEVKHDQHKPFVVRTSTLLITDLGTRFNVKAFATDRFTEASLIEGRIEVSALSSPDQKVILKPSQKISFVNVMVNKSRSEQSGKDENKLLIGKLTKNPVLNSIVETDWLQNRLTFNDDDFLQIASKMERWYGVKIEFEKENIKSYRFVGTFEKESLTEVLDVLKYSRDFNYRKEGERIVIY